MFDQLYKAQRAQERHLNAPLLDERIRYLSYWAVQGSTRSSLRVRAQDLLTFIDYLHLETANEIDEKQINKAADRSCCCFTALDYASARLWRWRASSRNIVQNTLSGAAH